MKSLLAGCLALAPWLPCALIGDAVAREPAPAVRSGISDQDLLGYLGNMLIEARLDADVTGDGRPDLAYVASNANERLVGVIAGAAQGTRLGQFAIGEARLPPSPQALVALGFRDGVLTVDDLTGENSPTGEMLTAATYRFRYEPPSRRMRLVELGAERYSPSLQANAVRVRWNLLTGRRVAEQATVEPLDIGEHVYIYGPEKSDKLSSPPVYMADTPMPEAFLGHVPKAAARVATDNAAGKGGASMPAP